MIFNAVLVNICYIIFSNSSWLPAWLQLSILNLYVQGYKQQKAFIVAQGPMESTCRDFWKMI